MNDFADALRLLPKVEIHLHIEGAIPVPALWELVSKYGSGDVFSTEELEERFRYRDFPHFLSTWMCPISNLRTGVVAELARHPLRAFFDRGLLVSVNTDDPRMFGTSLEAEYLALAEHQGFRLEEIRRLVDNAIDSTWAEEGTKARLRKELTEWASRVTIEP